MMTHNQALTRGKAKGVRSQSLCTGGLRYAGMRMVGDAGSAAETPVYQCDGCGDYLAITDGLVTFNGDIDDMPGWWTDTPEGQNELWAEQL